MPLAAALGYARRGWPVFPCVAGRKIPANPPCPHGFKDATVDEATVRSWWTRFPEANIAIATGAPAVDVLDVDVRPSGSGLGAFERLREAGLLAGALAIVRTPSGGLHVYFPGTGQPGGHLPDHHLDFKAQGGYVLAPPSRVDGRRYTLTEERNEGRPLSWQAVVAFIDPARAARTQRPADQTHDLRALVRWMRYQPVGNRNNALFWAACRAAEQGADPSGFAELVGAAEAAGLPPHEAERTVASAIKEIRRLDR